MSPSTVKRLLRLFCCVIFLSACSLPRNSVIQTTRQEPGVAALPAPTHPTATDTPQIGLNFIRFYWNEPRGGALNTTTSYFQPGWIFADFADLGIHAYRQFVRADLLWNIVEPQDDQWNFSAADAVLLADQPFEPIVTLFAMQFSSPTPPWVQDPEDFEKTIGPEAEEYLKTVVQRYAAVVKYWELGNEMNHWRAADAGETSHPGGKVPGSMPQGGFSPQEQGLFFAQAAAIIRQYDPDAVIVMPGMGGLDDYTLNTWLAGVVQGGGTDWFDILNYHYYSSWERYSPQRQALDSTLQNLGIADKPIWLTETGASASPQVTVRTNYPNSPETQAADIFRRIVQAYGHGDALVMWHTYISSPPENDNTWALYGIRTEAAVALPSYYTFKLLTEELIPFSQVEKLSAQARGLNAYRITTQAGQVRYVAWGSGNFQIPAGVQEYTSVIPDAQGHFSWQPAQSGSNLALNAIPLLLR